MYEFITTLPIVNKNEKKINYIYALYRGWWG